MSRLPLDSAEKERLAILMMENYLGKPVNWQKEINMTTKKITALQRFWMALNYEENKKLLDSSEEAYDFAMKECEYHPIDTRFCMVYTADSGWYLLEASGSAIVKAMDCGSME